jgi:hypothetical protein
MTAGGGDALLLGVVRSYTAGPPRTAAVRLVGGLETLLASVPVAAHVSGADLTAGRECVVAFLEPNDVSSAVLVGVVGASVAGAGMIEHGNVWHAPDFVELAGQLGGTVSSPDVRGLRETSGPTLLALGAVADGEYLRRSGATVVGGTPAAGGGGAGLAITFALVLGGD